MDLLIFSTLNKFIVLISFRFFKPVSFSINGIVDLIVFKK